MVELRGKKEIERSKLCTSFLTQAHTFTLIHLKKITLHKENRMIAKELQPKTTTKAVAVTNKHLRCSFLGKGIFFSSGGYILYSKHPNLSCGQHPKEAGRFWINQPLQTKGLRGMYTSMQKYQERQRPRNHPSLPAKRCFEGASFLTTSQSVGFCGEPEQGSSPLHFLHLKQSFLFQT